MRILAVDDDPLSLDLLASLIGQIGKHEIVRAESAVEALEVLSEEPDARFDCILLDIRMPGTSGIELCKIIRGYDCYDRTPVLMITAMSDKKNIDAAFAAGATDYLTKPFEISELRGRIQMIEGLLKERRIKADKIFVVKKAGSEAALAPKIDLLEPVAINDVDGVVEYYALENYVAQLSRKSLFGSTVLALMIVDFDKVHSSASALDLGFIITDVAEAISDALADTSYLMSYSGNGTFVCVIEGGWRPDASALAARTRENLRSMDLHLSDGAPLNIDVFAGTPVRLISRFGSRAVDALSEAQENVDRAYKNFVGDPLGKGFFWGAS